MRSTENKRIFRLTFKINKTYKRKNKMNYFIFISSFHYLLLSSTKG